MADLNHGINATLSIAGGTAIEGILDNASMDLQREIAEARHMGDDSVRRLAGLRSCQFTAEGDWDDTIDAALYSAWNGAASAAAVFSPDGVVTCIRSRRSSTIRTRPPPMWPSGCAPSAATKS